MFVKPAPGRSVPNPERGFDLLPETGMIVPRTSYWLRRIADGDVSEGPVAATAAPAPPVEPPAVAEPTPAASPVPARSRASASKSQSPAATTAPATSEA